MSPKRILGVAIAASALASSAALAATGTPERVRGTIASATADSVTVDTYADKPDTVALTGNTTYLKVEKSNMNRVMALAVAAFLTAGITTAYADGEGNGNFGGISPSASVVAGTEVTGVSGSDQYPVTRDSTAVGVVAGGTLPTNGSDGPVQTANSLPPGFESGTGNSNTAYASAQTPVVAGGTLPPNGSNGIVQTANSLPPGFGDVNGNPAIAYAQAQAAHNPRG